MLSFLPALVAAAAWAAPAPGSAALDRALDSARASREDLAIRFDRWDTRLALPAVDALLADPLSAGPLVESWDKRLGGAPELSAPFELAAESLGLGPATEPAGTIAVAIAAAKAPVAKALASMSEPERRRAEEVLRVLAQGDDPEGLSGKDFDVMGRFDQAALLSAARRIAAAVDAALPQLRAASVPPGRRKLTTPEGVVLLVSGPGDDEYAEADLEGVELLLDFGGHSRYQGSPAAAGPGQIRVVIDLSQEIVLESKSPAAGSGLFGIGLMVLPEPGRKKLVTGELSCGAGLFGVGALQISGGSEIESGIMSQGMGGFGVGILVSTGHKAKFKLRIAGQGFGMTRGVGLFLHRGDDAQLDGGHQIPDFREPLGMLSLSQGAGYGPRAFAAGGIGVARVEGSRAQLLASYMAQGMGYWRAFGALIVRGDENRVQGRRYVQGAGVHTAYGAFRLEGKGNRVLSWGVGPAVGWDYGIGALDSSGGGNSFASDWASARGDVNGHGLATITGGGNRIALGQFGTGAFKRGGPSYGIVAGLGDGDIVQRGPPMTGVYELSADPWGVATGGSDLTLDPALARETAQWPSVDRSAWVERDRKKSGERLARAEREPEGRRGPAYLEAAARAGFDNAGAIEAAERLVRGDRAELPGLLERLDPDDFGKFLWLRSLLPGFGAALKKPLKAALGKATGLRRALLLSFYRGLPVEDAWAAARAELGASDWRVRRESAALVGSTLARQRGLEAGRLRLLETMEKISAAPEAEALGGEKHWMIELGEQSISSLFSALALERGFSSAERAELLKSFSNPFEPARPAAFETFARIARRRAWDYAGIAQAERSAAKGVRPAARKELLRLLADNESEVAHAAIVALGAIGEPDDALALAPFLSNRSSLLREAAAASIVRIGEPALPEIMKALEANSPRVRAQMAAGLAQAGDPALLDAFGRALADADSEVRRTAALALAQLPRPLHEARRRFKPQLERLSKDDSSPSVRAAAFSTFGSL